MMKWPGRFLGIAGNAGNHENSGKFHKSDQTLNQTKREFNKLCLGKTVRIKFSVDSAFSNMFYGKKTPWKCRKSTESFLNQKSTQC